MSAVTVFAGGGIRGIADEQSRTAESLARSFALSLRGPARPKPVYRVDACLVVSPDHGRVFRQAGWSRARLREELAGLLALPLEELIFGGEDSRPAGRRRPASDDSGLLLAYAGGRAGLFSAIIEGWVGGSRGSIPVTKEVVP
jgi:hypothetical protein